MPPLYNGKVFRFKAKTAWKVYQENRRRSCRTYEAPEKRPFLQYVEKHFQEGKWSLDACVGRALEEGRYDRSEILCTKTLYNYVDKKLEFQTSHLTNSKYYGLSGDLSKDP